MNTRALFTLCVAVVLACLPRRAGAQGAEGVELLRCGRVIAVPGEAARERVTIVVKGGRIDSIIEGWDAKPNVGGAPVEVDLKNATVLPGLIDCHVHLTNEFDRTIRTRQVIETESFVALKAAYSARLTLEAGFTTVRDLGALLPGTIFGLRDAINAGYVDGPRIIAAGHAISITGGHGDFTLGYRPDIFANVGTDEGIADGADECLKAVRHQIKLGADVVKVTATGGVLSAAASGTGQHYTDRELEAIVTAAHAMGRKVAAHAHGTDGINAALKAGVDSIEHGSFLDAESVKLFKERGAYHVPTLLAGATVAKHAEDPGYYPAMVAAKARIIGPRAIEALRQSHAAGVKIAFGTDTGVSPHGENAKEFALLMQAGLTPTEAIVAATVTAAELLGLSDQIGTLAPGKAADLIVVKGDPLKDVTELERVERVMKAGRWVTRAGR